MNCLTKHALHRLNPHRDDAIAKEMQEGYALGLKWFKSQSPECDGKIIKAAVEEIASLVTRFMEQGGAEALHPDLRKLSRAGVMGFLVALFERAYS